MTKTCRLCGIEKPLNEFHRASGTKDGHRGECKDCFRAQWKARHEADPERRRRAVERAKAWQQRNPAQYAASQEAYRLDGRMKSAVRASHLLRNYGMTQADYESMLLVQGGACAICGFVPAEGVSLHIDHDHESGAVRGLLCFRCNVALGHLAEDVSRFARAVQYLERSDPDVADSTRLARDRVAVLAR